MKNKIISALAVALITLPSFGKQSLVYDITDYGAKGDSTTLNTKYIQLAIDAAAKAGGGTVYVPNGVFITGTIFLKSNTTLRLAEGGKLLGSPHIEDYTELTWGHNVDRQPYHLVCSIDQENVSIEGRGTIDGNGRYFWQDYEKDAEGRMVTPRWLLPKNKKVSPLIEMVRCQNVTVRDVNIKTGGGWNLHVHDCDLVKIQGVNIVNNIYSPNSDGIDITGCHDVIVSDCYIKTCDDAVCLKTTDDSRDCQRVTVTNCVIETLCVGLKMGCTESFKPMSDVTFSNCIINKSSRAIGIYVKEDADYNNISINNIVANTNAPLVLNRPIIIMAHRTDSTKSFGKIRNVVISNFICETEGRIILSAEEGCAIENVTLRDIMLRYPYIEDPRRYTDGPGSAQYPDERRHPDVGNAQAAVVANNIDNLVVDNLVVDWPTTDATPIEWSHPERIENGTMEVHRPDYSRARQTEMQLLWGRNLRGGYLHCPLSVASNGAPKYHLDKSTIRVTE
ncbi:MAG: right-handed parallel beta-helix repeat-containing protein [Bacteroidaceae bacterium]|nr:right-handed parallel beta-helix repeat-containing protein [Bacteroidaceae bacterium]